jgi:hypothetical protein
MFTQRTQTIVRSYLVIYSIVGAMALTTFLMLLAGLQV